MKTKVPSPIPLPGWTIPILGRWWPHLVLSIVILVLDLVTGPFLLFPILFVLPVMLSAWFYSARMAYSLAALLPVGRFLIAEFVDHPHPLPYMLANALIRIAVLLIIAFLVARTAQQTKELRERLSGLTIMCAWSRTVEYEGVWISFEQYLKRRFNIDTSHGISPAEAEKLSEDLKRNDRNA